MILSLVNGMTSVAIFHALPPFSRATASIADKSDRLKAVLSLHSLRLEQAAGKLVVLNVAGFPIKRRWYAVHLNLD